MTKFTKEEEREMRELAQEILSRPGVGEELLEIISRQSPGWLKAMEIKRPGKAARRA